MLSDKENELSWTPGTLKILDILIGETVVEPDTSWMIDEYGSTLLGAAEPNTEGDGK